MINIEGNDFENFDLIIQKIGFLALGILLIYLPYSIYDYVGYSGPFYIMIEFLLTVFGFSFILLSTISGKRHNFSKKFLHMIILVTILSVGTVIFIIGMSMKRSFTDEFAIEVLSAKRFLAGLNPYGIQYSIRAIESYGVSLSSLTPKLAGGYVTSLEYPDFSFLILIPFILLHINPEIVLFIFTLLLLSLIAIEFVERELAFMAPLALAVALFNINLIFFSLNGITDVIWVTFLAASLIFLQKRFIPGILYGLSLAAKQLPIFILPFLLIFVYKRYGFKKFVEFTITAALSFILINLPFILMSPSSFFNSILAPENAPILGIGFGLSQFYFSGYIPFADRQFFTALMISVWMMFIVIYMYKYDTLKYSLTALPIIVLIFNFRLLENYLMYWPILTLSTLPYIIRKGNTSDSNEKLSLSNLKKLGNHFQINGNKIQKIYKYLIPVLIVLIILIPTVVFVENSSSYQQRIRIESVTPEPMKAANGEINCLYVNVSYSKQITNLSLRFRILEDGFLNNPNGFFWNATVFKPASGHYYTSYHIYTNDSNYFLEEHNTYVIIAYNSNLETWYHVNIGKALNI